MNGETQEVEKILPINIQKVNFTLRLFHLYFRGGLRELELNSKMRGIVVPGYPSNYLNLQAKNFFQFIPADIIFTLQVKPHPRFKREGNDLVMKVEVNLYQVPPGVKDFLK
jgi:hypothetical protein